MSTAPPAAKKQKRRVSDSNRQRASVSCDRCKTRKIRCIRPNDSAPCASCAQLDVNCEATLPRKQRVYATYDQLQSRYRALDLLVGRLFPGEAVDTIEDIQELARRNGIDLSEIAASLEDQEISQPTHDLSINEDEGTKRGGSSASFMMRDERDTALFDSIHSLHMLEGALIPAPRDGFHYVGPSSSYLFANTVRQLVKKASAHPLASDRIGRRRQQRANEFTSSDRTTALEARIQGHPVMVGDDSEDSPVSDDTAMAPNGSAQATVPSPLEAMTPKPSLGGMPRLSADLLPDRKLGDRLVKAFFDRVHLNFNLFHRGTFQVRYESSWSPANRRPGGELALDPGWLCVLLMVFVLGSQALERDGLKEATSLQVRYLAVVVRAGLQRLILTATMSNVQALALLSLYQHNAGERNASWMLIGHASRMAVALGMQRDGESQNFDFIARNSRRTVWWTLFLFEQNLSFILGRPSATSTVDISASLPDESVTDGGDTPPGYLDHAVRLGEISAKVKRYTASVSPLYDRASQLLKTIGLAVQLDEVLQRWLDDLPAHLRPDTHFATSKHRRSVLLLHATFNHTRSVLGRPHLLCRTNHALETGGRSSLSEVPLVAPPATSPDSGELGPMPPLVEQFAQSSLAASRKCISTLIDLASSGSLEGEVWYDYYYMHHAALILSLPFLGDSSRQDRLLDRGLVSTALNLAQKSRLAPTYRILINVSIQFAKIVGIGPDDDPSRPSSPRGGPHGLHSISNLRGHTVDQPTDSEPRLCRLQDPLAHFATDAHATGSESFARDRPAPSSTMWPGHDTAHNDVSNAISNDFTIAAPDQAHMQPIDEWSLIPLPDVGTTTQPISLEQLLGMQLSSSYGESSTSGSQSVDFGFADMYGFGFDLPVQTSTLDSGEPFGFHQGDIAQNSGRGGFSDGRDGVPEPNRRSEDISLHGEIPWDFFGGDDWLAGGLPRDGT